MADPATLSEAVEKLSAELVAASRRAARAVVAHEEAKTAFDAAKSEMGAAEHEREVLRRRLKQLLDDEARGKPFDPIPEIPF